MLVLADENDPYGRVFYLSKLDGVKWNLNDPLVGIVEAISPFHMIDWWQGKAPRGKKIRVAPNPRNTKPSKKKPMPNAPISPGPPPPTPGLGKGMGAKKDEGSLGGNIAGAGTDVALDIVPLLGLLKTAYDLTAMWINSLKAGIEKSARNFSVLIFNDAIASMAVKIADNPNASIPKPDISLVMGALKQRIEQWKAPSDRMALELGRKKGLKFANDFINGLEKKGKGTAVKYLRWLKKKYKGNQVDIGGAVYQQLKERGIQLDFSWR